MGPPTLDEQRATVGETPAFHSNFRATPTPLFPSQLDTGRVDPAKYGRTRDQDVGIYFNVHCTKSECEHDEHCDWLYILSKVHLRWLHKTRIGCDFLRSMLTCYPVPMVPRISKRIQPAYLDNGEASTESS
jgi:hypothetical protein